MGKSNRFYADIMALHVEVTGSCILVNLVFPNFTKKVLVDCGLFQELDYADLNKTLPFDASNIDYVIVTHNHVDHTGRLPLLVKNGYRGDIHMSYTTTKLIGNALGDSYKVLRCKSKLFNEPNLYSIDDVEETLKHVKGHPYEESVRLDDNIKITFFMNGHLPGAACVLLQAKYRDHSKYYQDINLLFTGDYNNKNLFFDVPPIPKWVHQLPITIIQESTYGKMDSSEIKCVFEENMLSAIKENKEIVVPVFSLGRSQEILYTLQSWQNEGKLSKDIPIYLDGKLAMSYTNIYLTDGLDNKKECMDFIPENFTFISNQEMRSTIMADHSCKIILSTSGMGSHGPCQTYLPAYLKRENALIHFTGYCAEETLGRKLYDCTANDKIDVFGLQVVKKADVRFTSEFSAHAKADELIDFLRPFESLKFVLVNHGEKDSKEIYANRIIDEINPTDGVGILERDYLFRVDGYGLKRSFSSKF